MLMLDTIVLCGNTVDIQGESLFSWIFSKKKEPNGPPPEYVELAAKQWEWIERMLSSSKADYLFVSGHYPIHSTCEHGPFKCLIDKLDPLLRKYNVNAYFSGHDHNLQHIHIEQPNEQDSTSSIMDYIVCGAASRSDRSSKHMDTVPENALLFRYPTGWNPFSQIGFSNGAFIHAEVRPENASLNFYTGKQELKYQTTFYPRNKPSVQ
uniref:Calcineurin-like phosphoesterase domain-containing protein n=1 Tax=Ditylenchus dipsaci TaxID=166011 RepID=A0A915EAM8_9BILA